MQTHILLIQLAVAYTLTGAFIFTVIVTCMSLVGWVRFASSAQQKKLFRVLIVELMVVGVGFFGNFLKFDPVEVQNQIIHDFMSAPKSSARDSNFSESDFSASTFAKGKFDATNFQNSSFRGANFSRSDFRGADLSHIEIDQTTQLPKSN